MNIIQTGSNVSPWRPLRAWQLAFACTVALTVTGAVGVSNFERDPRGVTASPEAVVNVSDSEEPSIAVVYQAAESEGLVPDESEGGFRSPASLRERLQALRGEFSNALR